MAIGIPMDIGKIPKKNLAPPALTVVVELARLIAEQAPPLQFIEIPKKQVMRNPILLSSGSLRNYGLNRLFEIAAGTGFDGIEIIVDETTDSADPVYLRRMIKEHGLPIPAVHAPFAFIDPPGWEKEEARRVKRSVRLAEEIGASLVVLHVPFFTDRVFRRWLEEELGSFQETTRVVLGVENMPQARKPGGRLGIRLNGPSILEVRRKGIWRLIPSFFNPPCFPSSDPDGISRFPRVVLDTTHLATGGFDPVAAFDRLREKVVHVHLSNFDGREHLELRRGHIDIPRFIRHLGEKGYAGAFCLEIMPEYFPSHDEEYTRRLLGDNLALIRRNLVGSPSNSFPII